MSRMKGPKMQFTWHVTIVRLNGKPDFEYTEVRGRAPTPREMLECRAEGETVRGKVASWHHIPPKVLGNGLGVYEIRAGETA
jgi:hypothetical protein